jgi:hypothetical protein
MKRSEMLSKIASVIINYNEVDSVIKHEKALEIAETILKVQEEVGMYPPDRFHQGHHISEWEPENEEK